MNITKSTFFFWAICILFSQVTFHHGMGQILNVATFTMPVVAIALVLNRSFRFKPSWTHAFALFALAWPWISIGESQNVTEFLKSYIQLVGLVVFLVLCSGIQMDSLDPFRDSVNFFIQLASLHSGLLVLQCLAMNLFRTNLITSPLGPLSRFGPHGDPHIMREWETFGRANGFFSEPSTAAWYTSFALALCLSYLPAKHSRKYAIVLLAGLASTLSISAVVNVIVVYGVFVLVNRKSYFKMTIRNQIRIGSLIALSLAVLSYSIWIISQRSDEFFQAESSIYLRTISPMKLLSESLMEYPLGHALGDTRYIASKPYYVVNEALPVDPYQLHNGLHVIAFYFGFLGILVILMMAVYFSNQLFNCSEAATVFSGLMCAILENGAVWSPQFMLLSGFALFAIKCSRSYYLKTQ